MQPAQQVLVFKLGLSTNILALRYSVTQQALSSTTYSMVLKGSVLSGDPSRLEKLTNHHPLNAPYHLQEAIDFVNEHQTNILTHVFDLTPDIHAKAENALRMLSKPFTKRKQSNLFQYAASCDCGKLLPPKDCFINCIIEAARGTKALLEAALEMDDDSSILQMFMGREPFAKEIKGTSLDWQRSDMPVITRLENFCTKL